MLRYHDNNWAVILAGGNGQRLKPLTRLVSCDDRPKQFCPLFSGKTLLDETRTRVGSFVDARRIVSVVTREHQRFYQRTASELHRSTLIEQPLNRGTTAAVAYAVTHIAAVDRDAVIGIFPADHYYADAVALQRAIHTAYRRADAHADRVVLLGAEADRPEVAYGWIEPGRPLNASEASDVLAVDRFWEKPSPEQARELLDRHCLWNTFVMVGSALAFATLLQERSPKVWRAMQRVRQASPQQELMAAEMVYSRIPSSDFSTDVVARSPGRLAVVKLPGAGWTDLGDPARALAVLRSRGFAEPQLAHMDAADTHVDDADVAFPSALARAAVVADDTTLAVAPAGASAVSGHMGR